MFTDIFLDFGTDLNAINAIKDRLITKNGRCAYLKVGPENLKEAPSNHEKVLFNQIDAATRIHIMAHGEMSYPEDIYGYSGAQDISPKVFYHYKDVSNFLSKRLNIQELKKQNNNLKIDLTICFAGVNDAHFEVNLHKDLAESHGLNTDIIARTYLTTVVQNAGSDSGKKIVRSAEEKNIDNRTDFLKDYFKEWVQDQHHKPGTKLKLTWNPEGQAIIVDAYMDKFIREVLSLCKAINSTHPIDLSEVTTLCSTIETFSCMSMQKITDILTSVVTSINLSDEFLIEKLKKLNTISEKYNSIGTPDYSLLKFKESTALACSEMLAVLECQKIAHNEVISALREAILKCEATQYLEPAQIKALISLLKNTKNLVYAQDSPLRPSILDAYRYGRRALHPLAPIKMKTLAYKQP